MNIYSYYSNVPDLPAEDEVKLILLWRARWLAAGWQPFVLSEFHAQQHPLFANLDAAVSKLPSSNPSAYERACYLRWLALAGAGGGWMADYDVMPRVKEVDHDGIKFTSPMFSGPDPLPGYWHDLTGQEMNRIQILQTPCCPALVYCSPANAERFCRTVIDRPGLGNRPQGPKNAPHFSDQYTFESLVMEGADWIQVRDVVKLYSDKDWEKAPLIHFANAVMGPKKLLPRWRHIPELLK